MTASALAVLLPCALAAVFAAANVPGGASDATLHPAQKPIRVLFLKGGASHDWDSLAPILVDLLKLSGDFNVTTTKDRGLLTRPAIDNYDVIAFYTQGGDLHEDQKNGLQSFLARSGGIVGLHSATATFKTSAWWWKLVGGRFKGHTCREYEVECTAPAHPVTRCFSKLKVKDEDYSNDFYPGADIHVLARRVDSGDPVIWTRQAGHGRVIVNTLGHDIGVWSNRTFQTLCFRMFYWACGREPKPLPSPVHPSR